MRLDLRVNQMVHMLLRRALAGGAFFVYAGFFEWPLNRFV
jgi:hypothetical protein